MTFGSQIGREPGQEEHQNGITCELADAGTNNLPFAQQLTHQRPAKGFTLLGTGGHAAARGDVFALLLAQTAVFVRFAIVTPPDQRKQQPDHANGNKQRAPAKAIHNPEQQRREAGESEIFTNGIDCGRLCALVLREPCADHPAIDRKAWRFADAKTKTAQQQRFQPHGETVEQREQ